MRRLISTIIGTAILAALFVGVWWDLNKTPLPSITSKIVSSLPLPSPTPYPLPQTLSIPKLNVNAPIEHVGETAEGRMDVPKNDWNVAWYQHGPKPGERGNSVIAGHLDTATGSAIFYRLSAMEPGDEFTVTDALGGSKTFVVDRKKTFPDNGFPIEEVFGSSGETMLNLITCEGSFNPSTQLYSDRLVVFGRLKK